jgi:tetratricopeptide (TPR) repeat protein
VSPNQHSKNIHQVLCRALEHHNGGDLSEAKSLYQQILLVDSHQPDALHFIGVIAHQCGENTIAVDQINKALIIKPNYVEAYCNLGVSLAALGKHDEAVASYHKALTINPDYVEAYCNLGVALDALGKHDEAIASYQRALIINPGYAEAHCSLGVALYALGKYDNAVASYQKALTINPDYAEACCNYSAALVALGKYDEAVASCLKAITINSNYVEAHCNLGVALAALGRHDDAAASYQNALTINPDCAEAHSNLGGALFALGNYDEAVNKYNTALVITPNCPELYSKLGVVLNAVGKHDDAVANYQKALSLKPDCAKNYCNLGNALGALEKFDDAVASYQKALIINPINVEAHCNLGNALGALGQIDEAIASYQKALTIKPDCAEVYSNLCEIYEKHHMIIELEKAVQLAQQILPKDDPHLLYRMAQLASREKRFEDALKFLEYVNPSSLSIKIKRSHSELLGKTYDKLGLFTKAFNQFEITNKITRKSPEIKLCSSERYFEQILQLIENWSKFDKIKRPKMQVSVNQHSLVFLVGFPRSGTTLLDTILRSHPETCVIEEKPTVEAMNKYLSGPATPDLLTGLNYSDIDDLKRIYFEELYSHIAPNSQYKIIIDKHPLNLINIGIIHRVFPNSKFIFALRHPYDCVLSCFMQNFKLNSAMINFLTLQQSAKLYNAVMKLWSCYNRALNLDVGILKYEDLVEDLQGTVEPLLINLGLEWNDSLLNYQETAMLRGKISTASYNQVTQSLYRHASGRWKNYKTRLDGIIPILEPWVKAFEY